MHEQKQVFHVKQGISAVASHDSRRGQLVYCVMLKDEDGSDIIESTYHEESLAIERAKYLAKRRTTRESVLKLIKGIEKFKNMER